MLYKTSASYIQRLQNEIPNDDPLEFYREPIFFDMALEGTTENTKGYDVQ